MLVTDENGCSVDITVEITETTPIQIIESHSDYTGYGVSCNGAEDGFIDVTVTGGDGDYTYSWSNGAFTEDVEDLGSGIYTLLVTDERGCTEEITINLTQTDPMFISEIHSDYTGYGVSCNGAEDGFIDVTVIGGTGQYTYTWTKNGVLIEEDDQDLYNLSIGTYIVVATDENGCSTSILTQITESAAMSIAESHSDYMLSLIHI